MMLKNCLPLILVALVLTSCSNFNRLFDTKASLSSRSTPKNEQRSTFLSGIEVKAGERVTTRQASKMSSGPTELHEQEHNWTNNTLNTTPAALEKFVPLQFKYAIMLNATVEKVTNMALYQAIDEWFGTRYRYGGTTRRGIDCSAFMQVLGGFAFGWMLPRTAHEQYRAMQSIEKEELQEGDLVFFNTRGGVSHVGMYLQNNKFVHASTSNGVMISDLDETYWANRLVGFKRVSSDMAAAASASAQPLPTGTH